MFIYALVILIFLSNFWSFLCFFIFRIEQLKTENQEKEKTIEDLYKRFSETFEATVAITDKLVLWILLPILIMQKI